MAFRPAATAAAFASTAVVWTKDTPNASASRGLVKFPCDPKEYELFNTYHLVRSGQSLLEEEGIWETNPLFLTNRDAALSIKGMEQAQALSQCLRADGVSPTIIKYSLAAASIDTADMISKELKVGRDRIIPEFTFMDPRAIGAWDMSRSNVTMDAVWAMDADEAGKDGTGGRPPPNTDGTPHETLADQTVRLRQVMSVLETQFSGDTIVLVFPDGTSPALLTCLIGGVPLNRVHEFEFKNGEIRLNVDYEYANQLLSTEPSQEYKDIIANGRRQLKELRKNPDQVLNVREQQYAEQTKREEADKAQKEEEEMIENENRRKEEEMIADEKRRMVEEKKRRTAEELIANVEEKKKGKVPIGGQMESTRTTNEDLAPVDSGVMKIGAYTGLGIVGVTSLFSGGRVEEETTNEKTESAENDTEPVAATNIVETETELDITKDDYQTKTEVDQEKTVEVEAIEEETTAIAQDTDLTKVEEEEGEEMATTEEVRDDDMASADTANDSIAEILDPQFPPVVAPKMNTVWDPDEDDGGMAWLGALSDMMDEDEDEAELTKVNDDSSNFQ